LFDEKREWQKVVPYSTDIVLRFYINDDAI